MENAVSIFNTSQEANLSNVSSVISYPALAVIYTPIFLVQLLVGLVSNLLLLTLLVKATSVKNNINVYLCSMAANNLLSLFPLLTLVVSTVTKQWVLGQTMCTINQVIIYMVSMPNLLLPVFISRERYRAVLHFMEWKPFTRRTYLEVAVVWICAVGSGMVGLLQGGQIFGETDDIISCYAPNGWLTKSLSPLYIVYLVVACVVGPAALLFSAVHYVYIFRELYKAITNHAYGNTQPLRSIYQDAPIQWKSELRALNSMACVFIMTAVPFTAGSLYATVMASVAIAKNITVAEANVPLVQLACVFFYLVPTSSPLVILVINKRFRMRIKDLFGWQLKPDNDTTSAVATSNSAVISHNNRILPLPQPQHQAGISVTFSSRPRVLYNSWMSE